MYALAKTAPALFGTLNVLDERHELFAEVEVYAAAEQRVEAVEAARQRRRARRGK